MGPTGNLKDLEPFKMQLDSYQLYVPIELSAMLIWFASTEFRKALWGNHWVAWISLKS